MASVAILAGGQARRFDGRDKSALVVDNRTIMDRLLVEAAAISDDVTVVGGMTAPAGARHVADRWTGCGPLGGLEAALREAREPEVIVVACDMPLVSAALLQLLLEALGDHDAAVPATERGYHPLCAVYAGRCHAKIVEHLTRGDLKMMRLLHALRVRTVAESQVSRYGRPELLLANVNTPAAFDEINQLLSHKL
jgi:molybdopterin-guanine dinucleotide biosynthesis protein A